jgi:MSHA pilin protein MshA
MKQVQRGFTLIELVMVIVILGVLAAVAVPKFVDLKGDAQEAAMKGVAGAAASASSINYAGCSVATAASFPAKCKVIKTCANVENLMSGGKWPTGYTAVWDTINGTDPATASGQTIGCKVELNGYTTGGTPAGTVTSTAFFDMISAGF